MNAPESPFAALTPLVAEFYPSLAPLGDFMAVTSAAMPATDAELLAHEHHMTVTVERHHDCPVDVRVLDKRVTPSHYARTILLTRTRDGAVVQYGIMRVALAHLEPEVQQAIVAEQTPLGRILIEHHVLRRIRLQALWRIAAGPELARHFDVAPGTVVYGRSALIECNGEPAVELLEIVTPA